MYRNTLLSIAAGVLALVGCASSPYIAARPTVTPSPEPGGVSHDTGTFERGRATLFWQCWRPVTGTPRAAVVLVHGFKDHSGRYATFAQRLVSLGYAVYAMDQRGHGRSSGERTLISDFDTLVADLHVFVRRVRRAEHGRPTFLFGHSMGGVTVTKYALDYPGELAGLILSAPALRVDRLPLEVAAIPLAAALAPHLALLDLPNRAFSRDPRVVADMEGDPFIYNGAGPATTTAALARALVDIWARAGQLRVPLLALHGTADTLTDPRGSAALVRGMTNAPGTLKLYDGLVHDLLHEPEHERVVEDITRWIMERLERSCPPWTQ